MLGRLLTFPVDAFIWLLQELKERAEEEMYDETRIRQELLELESRAEAGVISREEYEAGELALVRRLAQARRWRAEREAEE
ncbi:MAG: gas vesicle protein GvpG [Bacillota bacterium]|nr:gas vesicle protein GvpG [Bacillota bacterium]